MNCNNPIETTQTHALMHSSLFWKNTVNVRNILQMKERGLADTFNMIIQTEFIIKDNAQISYSTSWDDAMTIDVAVVYITGNTDVKH